jgi:hypothetical protein
VPMLGGEAEELRIVAGHFTAAVHPSGQILLAPQFPLTTPSVIELRPAIRRRSRSLRCRILVSGKRYLSPLGGIRNRVSALRREHPPGTFIIGGTKGRPDTVAPRLYLRVSRSRRDKL